MKKLIATACMFALGLSAPASVAQAHATCEHFAHTDWHWSEFHNDIHTWGGHAYLGSSLYDFFDDETHHVTDAWYKYCGH